MGYVRFYGKFVFAREIRNVVLKKSSMWHHIRKLLGTLMFRGKYL